MLLSVKDLHTHFQTDDGIVRAVDGVSLSIDKGEFVALVGGSGSGKSILASSIMGLVPEPGHIVGGEIVFGGMNLVGLNERELNKIRGARIAMIFQEPMTSLNPVFTVGDQIAESITTHEGATKKVALKKAEELLAVVGIPEPHRRIGAYPFELSGGQRQRVMIAMALACGPDILIADEPTTALDVTVQAQILGLISSLREKLGMAVLLITHDFGIVAENADRVYVMHNGKIVEDGNVLDIFKAPKDEYTKKLINSVPGF
jgi:ABC-type dipeptide/oligopeptide/nickel transport system ATPase component